MCLAKAYSGQEMLAEEIASVKVSDGKILLTTIFGEQQELDAAIREIDFRDSRIILEKAA
jgi:predicted RNA-binding protein